MRLFLIRTCLAGCLLCAIALAISVYPGTLQQMLCVLVGLGVLVVPLWFVRLGIILVKMRALPDETPHAIPWRWGTMTFVIIMLTYGTLRFYVPRRIAFALHQDAFQAHLASAPISDYGGDPLDKWLGLYHVDAYARDPRGGVYFRTGAMPDMVDQYSWGFVYQPNSDGTPFGNAHYRVRPLGGQWYWFVANDDW